MVDNIANQLKEVHKKLLSLKNENTELKCNNQQLKQKILDIQKEIEKKKREKEIFDREQV